MASDLTDDELSEQLNALSVEKERRDEARRKREAKDRADRVGNFRTLAAQHPELIDALAPNHRPGRYGDTCSDVDTRRGLSWDDDTGKGRPCPRCRLLDLVLEDWRESVDFDLAFEVLEHD